MVNEAKIFSLPRRRIVENWVTPNARMWRPALINS